MANISMSLEYCMPQDRLYNPEGMDWLLEKSMKDVTPEKFKCSLAACPAVYDLDDGNILIVGKLPTPEQISVVKNIGNDELAIVIPKEMLDNVGKDVAA